MVSERRAVGGKRLPGGIAEYPLLDGYVHNWLVAGPCARPRDPAQQPARASGGQLPERPVESAAFASADCATTWRYASCLEDHILDLSACYDTPQSVFAWAYARLAGASAREAVLELAGYGPAGLWLDGEEVRPEDEARAEDGALRRSRYRVKLKRGDSHVLIRLQQEALRECPLGCALRILPPGSGSPVSLRVRLPVYTHRLAERAEFEQAMQAAYLDREVYPRDETVLLHWAPGLEKSGCVFGARLQTPDGLIHGVAPDILPRPDLARYLARSGYLPDGAYQVLLLPDMRVYYGADDLHVARALPLYLAGAPYAPSPRSSYAERRAQALEHAARRAGDVFAELAKLARAAMSPGSNAAMAGLDKGTLAAAIDNVARRAAGSELALLGLLGMLAQYGEAHFPAELLLPLERAVLGFRYWAGEPGHDALDFESEDCQIVCHACAVLAGQRYPDAVFGVSRQTGRRQRARGEELALSWLRGCGRSGCDDWDSHRHFERVVAALVHLAALAESAELVELASVMLDQLLLSLALNSFRGTFGSAHARAGSAAIKSGRLDPTSSIGWLLWGMGGLNQHIAGLVSLACLESYALPAVIAVIATDDAELWNKECHGGRSAGRPEVDKVTFRTADYMLCSAQDFRAGQRGAQEHVWQATLGPDAVTFVNHPACFSQSDAIAPNFWRGNAILPRVAQWRDALIAIYRAGDEGLDFTHAFFPALAFDEHALHAGWAFARLGQGYLAVAAQGGLSLVTAGDSACRELRSPGRTNVWLCQMGRAASDGSFADFQSAVLARQPTFDGGRVRWSTLRGDTLSFGWHGPLLVNGAEQPLSGFRRYDSPYAVMERGASTMTIRAGTEGVELDFG